MNGAVRCTSTASASRTAPIRREARRLHQLRDTVVHVVDELEDAQGWGNCQPMITGASPEHGLAEADSFV